MVEWASGYDSRLALLIIFELIGSCSFKTYHGTEERDDAGQGCNGQGPAEGRLLVERFGQLRVQRPDHLEIDGRSGTGNAGLEKTGDVRTCQIVAWPY